MTQTIPSETTGLQTFWQRQFSFPSTQYQRVFDVTFGIVMPVCCIICDPIVFRTAYLTLPFLGRYSQSSYLVIVIGLLALSYWIYAPRLPRIVAALYPGLLAGVALFATILGIVLFPVSVIGLIVLIGALGFGPFLTAFVFWRNCCRAFATARKTIPRRVIWFCSLISLLLSVGIPMGAQGMIEVQLLTAFKDVTSGDAARASQATKVLRPYYRKISFDQILVAYEAERDEQHRQTIALSYEEIVGYDINSALNNFHDDDIETGDR